MGLSLKDKMSENKQTHGSYLFSSKPFIFDISTDYFKFLSTNYMVFSMSKAQFPFVMINEIEINVDLISCQFFNLWLGFSFVLSDNICCVALDRKVIYKE